MKLVEPENAEKFLFLGGKVSPSTIFQGLHAYAYVAAGPEIVQIHFDTNNEAAEAEKRLKNISADAIAKIERHGNILSIWPHHLKKNPLETPERKYKIAYKLLSALAIMGELYYNDETGEIYVDEVDSAETVQKLVGHYGQHVYVIADKEREYVSLSSVDYTTRSSQG